MEILAAKIFIEAAILCGLLRMIAKHEADYSYSKVVLISAAITTSNFFIMALGMPHIGLLVVIPMAVIVTFMLTTFCWISGKKSILVVAIYLSIHLGLTALGVWVDQKASGSVDAAMSQPAMRSANETIEVLDGFYGEGVGDAVMSGESLMPVLPPATDPAIPQEKPEVKPKPKELEKPEPEPVVVKKGGGEWAEAVQLLSVGSVMTKKNSTVVWINGGLYETGEEVMVDYNGKTFVWVLLGAKGKTLDLEPLRTR